MIRFQADADLNFTIVRAALRLQPSLDFQSAVEADLEGLPDLEVLRTASEQSRILVSHDVRTMPHHFAEFVRHRSSPGLILIPQAVPVAAAADGLVVLAGASTEEEWVDRIYWLDF